MLAESESPLIWAPAATAESLKIGRTQIHTAKEVSEEFWAAIHLREHFPKKGVPYRYYIFVKMKLIEFQ